jgi:hypothetical protein
MGSKHKKNGKKGKKSSANPDKPDIPIPYTLDERSKKWTNICFELMKMHVYEDVVTRYVSIGMKLFVDVGRDFHYSLDLPQYSRVAEFHFVNDKRKEKENGLKLTFKKIRVEGEDDEHPINKLNKMQEHLF